MNRIKLQIIKQNTSISIKQLDELTICNPYSQGWMSEKFPVFPIIINFYLANPPFNRISLSMNQKNLPQKIILYGSADSKQYFKFKEIAQFHLIDPTNIIINLEQIHHYKYLRIRIEQPSKSEFNICKQIFIRCIQITNITIYGAEYTCSMKSALTYDPYLFRMLEILEYKALLTRKKDRELSAKHTEKIKSLFARLKNRKQNVQKLSEKMRQQLLPEIKQIVNQPIDSFSGQSIEYDRQAVKKQVKMLEDQLSEFYVYRLNCLHKDVTDYFSKYWNVQIKEEFMRLLSSPDKQDHGKALSSFWAELKKLGELPSNIEQAAVMFFNYFLEYVHDPLKISAIKIMCLLFRNPSLSFDIYFVYQRVLFNLYSQLRDSQNQQLYDTSLKCIYTLFQKVPDNLFLQALLNPEHSVTHKMKLTKLQILQKLTFKNITIQNKDMVFDFLLDILLLKNLTLIQKNKAYNVTAYLASLIGKQATMAKFEKLNTMITMSMQNIIDKKMEKIRKPKQSEEIPSCDYCGITKEAFKDPSILDLHCFKQCKYLNPCKYCSQIVQIPELYKHYIHQCKERNLFKQCEDCNDTIVKDTQEQHKKVCKKMLSTKCPLCNQKMQGKLKLKEHVLKDGCPNNQR